MADTQATRLILTQLPPSLTTPLLRAHLLKCPPSAPQLTDCKVLTKPDGTSRRIAFAGFKDHAEAERIKSWADGSWVQGTSSGGRIRVDWAKDAQDAPRPRKRAKLTPPPADNIAASPAEASTKPSKAIKDEASRFAEFMAVMGPRKGRALEDINSGLPPATSPSAASAVVTAPTAPAPAAPLVAKPVAQTPAAVVEEAKEAAPAPTDGVADDEEISDMEYMARRMKRTLEVEEELRAEQREEEMEEGITAVTGDKAWVQDEEDAPKSSAAIEGRPEAEAEEDELTSMLNESPRLFIRNLGFTITEQELTELLEPFGALDHIHIPLDPATKAPKGLAYATFVEPSSALAAFEALDRRSFQGRLLHILPAVARNVRPVREGKENTVKSARDFAKKAEANTGLSWGTLFMNADAVMSSVADRLKIDKSVLLDPSSDNAAVRVALAETHVIQETKQYFEEEGVDLASLGVRGPRSTTTILVKNIPYGTSSATLSALFTPFGPISRLLIPPAGTIAIVEMEDASATGAAWRALQYKKLGASVLYLEKAPASMWNSKPKPKTAPPAPTDATTTMPGTAGTTPTTETPAEVGAGATLFIKNLSFNTTTPGLTNAFSSLAEFVSARVQTKPDPKKPGATLSMGFGFVAFRSAEGAATALKVRNGFVLDGHKLEVKFAQRGKEEVGKGDKDGKKRKEGKGTKLIVKNVPFEVTKKDIQELFSAYGQLKSVRLPRKLDRHTRGFAFLDFVSHQEAVSAFNALEHTHLLGRHLVLQWAEEGTDEVEALRKRTGYSDSKVGNKKAKFVMEEGGSKAGAGAGGDDDDDED